MNLAALEYELFSDTTDIFVLLTGIVIFLVPSSSAYISVIAESKNLDTRIIRCIRHITRVIEESRSRVIFFPPEINVGGS